MDITKYKFYSYVVLKIGTQLIFTLRRSSRALKRNIEFEGEEYNNYIKVKLSQQSIMLFSSICV